jgi:nucleotide-binding universal stress UspA family protein
LPRGAQRGNVRAMVTPRTSFQTGHSRKFLVVVDETPECDRALVYAAKRAERTGGTLTMMFVIRPEEFQHWLGVEDIMRAEARAEAEATLAKALDRARAVAPRVAPETVVREGSPADEIIALIGEDADIAILVLAAGTEKEGPGPLVSSLAGRLSGSFPIPITIVPGTLSDADLAALA